MKKTTITLLLSFSCCWLAAQCPTGDITFTTQGQIDSFPMNYPNCSEMESSIVISGSSIVRLDSLYPLKKIGGSLKISQTSLTDLQGLQNLTYTGLAGQVFGIDDYYESGLDILDNPLLASLHGLENLATVKGCVEVGSNQSLASLSALGSLEHVGSCEFHSGAYSSYGSITLTENPALKSLIGLHRIGSVPGDVTIWHNIALKSMIGLDHIQSVGGELSIRNSDSLTTLSGLENLDSLGMCLYLQDNPALVSLDALAGLRFIGSCLIFTGGFVPKLANLSIVNNPMLNSLQGLGQVTFIGLDRVYIKSCPMLSVCEIQPICAHLAAGALGFVSDNAPGCNSVAEIEAACMVSIEETSSGGPVLLLSPSPASDFLQIQISDPETWDLRLFDLQGRQMFRQSVSGSQTIPLHDWPAGLYTLRAVSGGRVFTGKVVKQ
ncbi:MAG: T9SS type A sorting domain-containing protein [Saprospiraceae bacterium]|nr:T9SS type A sorting domain-containing protein [Saprospiraceae bacterium]